MPNKTMLYLLSVEAISLADMDTINFNHVTTQLTSKSKSPHHNLFS